ncbi:MAG: HypC/HybG/HupF family hydrogenase formation chaperone [Gaiella sp.]|nr:HypC/HybG/HupF family hydrogenase formation chaperone [Gaiella sp.]
MCLGIPGRIAEVPDRRAGLATVDISGVRRSVSIALVDEPAAPVEPGDWVLVHVGFALARIDEADARETLDLLRRGAELSLELEQLREGTVAP